MQTQYSTSTRRSHGVAIGLAAVASLLGSLFASTPASASPFAVDISKREEARVFYNTVYRASDGVAMDWTGSIADCNPGSVSESYLQATRERINYFRALAGVPSDITFTDDNNRLAQAAALAMSANKALNHEPPTTWQCYSADVAAGASSNLALGTTGPAAIDALIRDGAELGHRRWLLYPQQLTMGSGNVPRTAEGSFQEAAANYVFGDRRPERPAVRDEFVAWPPNGFIPFGLVPPRWSLSLGGADFSTASVTITRGDAAVPVDIKVRAGEGGFGEPALVWLVNDLAEDARWARPDADEVYNVTVADVQVNGEQRTFNYTVSVFDPAVPGADYTPAVVTGPDTVSPNQTVNYSFSAVPNATAYQWRSRKLSLLRLTDGADDGLGNWNPAVSGTYDVLDTAGVGQPVFRLSGTDLRDQRLTFARTLQASADSQLTFKSRLFFTQGLAARVEVSTDAGATWTPLFEQIGANEAEPEFSDKVIELGAFAGKPALLRFSLSYIVGETVFGGDVIGWYFDDIRFVDLREVGEPVVSPVIAGPTFDFVPTERAEFDLDVRPQFYDQYPGEFGPSKRVRSVEGEAPAETPAP